MPFTVLYKRAVQLLDRDDLSRLDAFAAFLKLSAATDTHPQLYEVLCQSASIYIDAALNLNDFSQPQSFEFDSLGLREGLDDSAFIDAGNWY